MIMNYVWTDKKRTLFGLPLSFTRYSLTEERFFVETGFLNKKEDEVRLYRIMDVSLTRSLGQRMFGVGTIHCCSADKSMGDFDILSVKNPRDVKEMLSEMVEKERVAKRVSNREYMMHDDDAYDDEYDHEYEDDRD
ncbi:MAG: PH domain-containing protein [Lachnospiraceae bacterium]|nr:PH domain-containing protein [Lachnospiraceae bacterium]